MRCRPPDPWTDAAVLLTLTSPGGTGGWALDRTGWEWRIDVVEREGGASQEVGCQQLLKTYYVPDTMPWGLVTLYNIFSSAAKYIMTNFTKKR